MQAYGLSNKLSSMCFQIGTGFKDEQLEQHTEFFKSHLLEGPRPYYRYNESTQPDQWFDSVQVMARVGVTIVSQIVVLGENFIVHLLVDSHLLYVAFHMCGVCFRCGR